MVSLINNKPQLRPARPTERMLTGKSTGFAEIKEMTCCTICRRGVFSNHEWEFSTGKVLGVCHVECLATYSQDHVVVL